MAKNKFSRPQKFKEIGAKVIIFCEGETEEIYFEAIRKSKRLSTVKINVVNPNFTDPENIVKSAIEYLKELKKDKRWIPEDQVWAVYDGDEHKRNNLENWQRAISLAEKENIKLGISNPSFELWYLLHYQNQNASIDRKKTFEKLKEHLPNYEKTADLFENDFKPLTEQALTRAENLETIRERDNLEKYRNPTTRIYLLTKRLFEL